jgi:hypothetical protein
MVHRSRGTASSSDTHVFLVLSRKPQVPQYIVSQSFCFRIDVDGQFVGYDRETEGRGDATALLCLKGFPAS